MCIRDRYQTIRKHKTTRELYADALETAGAIPAGGGKALVDLSLIHI